LSGGDSEDTRPGPETANLRRGWTTGACATAAARAAYEALLTGTCPPTVEIELPGGERPAFAIANFQTDGDTATAGVVKDAGDDPDVTHGALVKAKVSIASPGDGVSFHAGDGVGTVTKPGLQIPPGEPAINPVPRQMIATAIREAAERHGGTGDVAIEISVPGGQDLAEHTLNARLGILGGISILGTTGIVIPYSCAAWIHAIHRGIDVARATGVTHVAAATGSTSEAAVQNLYSLPEAALLDMGDFAGGTLKYLRKHPVARVTVAGGFAKMTKLAQGLLDLHSKRGEVDFDWIANEMSRAGANESLVEAARTANTAQLALQIAREGGVPLGNIVAEAAWQTAAAALDTPAILLDVTVFDRTGQLVGRTEPQAAHASLPR
jgi:cobalt-precorrin-5B (C1)-methyltransferase